MRKKTAAAVFFVVVGGGPANRSIQAAKRSILLPNRSIPAVTAPFARLSDPFPCRTAQLPLRTAPFRISRVPVHDSHSRPSANCDVYRHPGPVKTKIEWSGSAALRLFCWDGGWATRPLITATRPLTKEPAHSAWVTRPIAAITRPFPRPRGAYPATRTKNSTNERRRIPPAVEIDGIKGGSK